MSDNKQNEPVAWQYFKDGKWLNGLNTHNHREIIEASGACTRDLYTHPAPAVAQGEPLFWYRPTCNGEMYEGPYHNSSNMLSQMRKSKPDEWKPLYTHPAPAVAQEPVHFRAVLCGEQQDQAFGVVPKVVGFVDKKAAEQFILEKRDFQGWRYSLEPLYTEAPAVAVNEQMYNALKMVMDDPQSLEGRPRTFECVTEAIAAYEAAKKGV